MKPRIIVCGLGQTGYKIFSLLKQQGASVVGISNVPIPGESETNLVIGNLRSPATAGHPHLGPNSICPYPSSGH